ncbi:MAG: phosphate uptake regulator PhoU [Candidatus Woesearchaeota archaeon]|nr:phosphate uptake regulator PhoU [Candidatus Woesearchaeota archaeon]
MLRKIVKHGPSTLTISLPSGWCKENKIEEGKELEVVEHGANLKVLSVPQMAQKRAIRIVYGENVDFLKRVLINLYRKGYDEITITSKIKIPRSRISSKMLELVGFEVIEHTETRLVIKNIAQPKEEGFEIIFRRLYRLALSFAMEVNDALKKQEMEKLGEIALIDKEINKLYNFSIRMLNRSGGDFEGSGYLYMQTINFLEQVGDQLDEMCSDKAIRSSKISNAVLDIFDRIIVYFELIYSLKFDFDYSGLLRAEKLREKLFDSIKSAFRQPKSDYIMLSYMHMILESLFHIETYLLNVEDHLSG